MTLAIGEATGRRQRVEFETALAAWSRQSSGKRDGSAGYGGVELADDSDLNDSMSRARPLPGSTGRDSDELLARLQVRRDPERTPRPRRRWPLVLAAAGGGLVVLAAAGVALIRPDLPSVTTAVVRAGWASTGGESPMLDASGFVVARRQATVSSKISGKVVAVLVEAGDHVTAGQVIAELDSSNLRAALAQAQAQAAAAKANLEVSDVTIRQAGLKQRRAKSLHDAGYLSDEALQDSAAAYDAAQSGASLARSQLASAEAGARIVQSSIDDTLVRAPFTGVLTAKTAQPGEIVAPVAGGGFTRTGVGTIIDMDSLQVQVDVAETFINRIHRGLPARIKLDAYPDWEIAGEVVTVVPTADRSKGTVGVVVAFKTRDPRILPEMAARVAFLGAGVEAGPTRGADRTVIVPPTAVATSDAGQAFVYVVADGRAKRRAVRLGDKVPQGQLVLAGLGTGETVATTGVDQLKDGGRVRTLTTRSLP